MNNPIINMDAAPILAALISASVLLLINLIGQGIQIWMYMKDVQNYESSGRGQKNRRAAKKDLQEETQRVLRTFPKSTPSNESRGTVQNLCCYKAQGL